LEHIPEIDSIAKRKKRQIHAHIYINTGMNRDGITTDEFHQFLDSYEKYDSIIWEGICSHLAASDAEDKSFALHQIEIFKQMIELAKSRGINFKYKHIANSGAIASIPQSHFNLVRPGISIHGLTPRPEYAEKLNLNTNFNTENPY